MITNYQFRDDNLELGEFKLTNSSRYDDFQLIVSFPKKEETRERIENIMQKYDISDKMIYNAFLVNMEAIGERFKEADLVGNNKRDNLTDFRRYVICMDVDDVLHENNTTFFSDVQGNFNYGRIDEASKFGYPPKKLLGINFAISSKFDSYNTFNATILSVFNADKFQNKTNAEEVSREEVVCAALGKPYKKPDLEVLFPTEKKEEVYDRMQSVRTREEFIKKFERELFGEQEKKKEVFREEEAFALSY